MIFGVHRYAWGQVGEIEILTDERATAEERARLQSADWLYGELYVTGRELNKAGSVRVMSVWKNGEKVSDYGVNGEWRKVQANPL